MNRPVTLCTGQWADLPLEKLAEDAASWGYDGLELTCWGDHMDVEKAVENVGIEAVNGHQAFGFNYAPHHLGYQGVDDIKLTHIFLELIFHLHMKDAWWVHSDHTKFGDSWFYWKEGMAIVVTKKPDQNKKWNPLSKECLKPYQGDSIIIEKEKRVTYKVKLPSCMVGWFRKRQKQNSGFSQKRKNKENDK